MLRIFFIIILIIHGLIHLIGFVRELRLAEIPKFSGKTIAPLSPAFAKIAGYFWGLTCLLFIITGISFLLETNTWWITGIAAIILSQLLIILYWKDAKAGTIANIIILPFAIIAMSDWNFQKESREDIVHLFSLQSTNEEQIIRPENLDSLPAPVKKWLIHSGVVGREKIKSIRLQQSCSMLTAPGGKWSPASAFQYFTVQNPGFVWTVRMEMSAFMPVAGCDKYVDGKGSMNIKAYSLINIVNSQGEEIDKGSMMRYLAEMTWFPSGALEKYMKWEAIDSISARAIMTCYGQSVTGVFTFDEFGNIKSFDGMRYGEFNGKYSLEPWHISCSDYRTFSGIIIPSKSEVTWKLKDGDFTWFKVEIKELEYNNNQLYQE